MTGHAGNLHAPLVFAPMQPCREVQGRASEASIVSPESLPTHCQLCGQETAALTAQRRRSHVPIEICSIPA
jgi:hypothetical protein